MLITENLFSNNSLNRLIDKTLKLENQDEMPLLNVRDARLLVIAKAFATKKEVDLCLEHNSNKTPTGRYRLILQVKINFRKVELYIFL